MREVFDDIRNVPSPSNVRVISGYPKFTITEIGKNKSTVTTSSFGTVYHGYVDLASGTLVVES